MSEEYDSCVSDRLADARPNPECESIQSELHGQLMQLVTELSPSLRTVIQLRDLDGMGTGEVARILEVPVGTVKTRIARARSILRQAMCEA